MTLNKKDLEKLARVTLNELTTPKTRKIGFNTLEEFEVFIDSFLRMVYLTRFFMIKNSIEVSVENIIKLWNGKLATIDTDLIFIRDNLKNCYCFKKENCFDVENLYLFLCHSHLVIVKYLDKLVDENIIRKMVAEEKSKKAKEYAKMRNPDFHKLKEHVQQDFLKKRSKNKKLTRNAYINEHWEEIVEFAKINKLNGWLSESKDKDYHNSIKKMLYCKNFKEK